MHCCSPLARSPKDRYVDSRRQGNSDRPSDARLLGAFPERRAFRGCRRRASSVRTEIVCRSVMLIYRACVIVGVLSIVCGAALYDDRQDVMTNHWYVRLRSDVGDSLAHKIAKRNGFNMIRPVGISRCAFVVIACWVKGWIAVQRSSDR